VFRQKLLSTVILVGMLFSQSVPLAMAATLCDSAQFVSDLTIPDGSSFQPGTTFTKTWRLSNNGTCTWTTYYKLVWVGGDQMNAPLSVNLPVNVPPGRMLDLSVRLTAPTSLGHYKALFKISNTKGTQFGIGSSSNDPFWVDINVVDVSAVIYDFVANAPYAQWKSGAGALPFPGTSGDFRGYSYQVNSPHLEDDSYDTAPGLLTVPQNKYSGYIQATYPEFQVQAGDRLQTLVNCEFGATGCYVAFRIDYILPNNAQKTLWTWTERYDNRFYRANLDLNSLAGQKVRFVLMLLSSGFASGDRAIWGSPRIIRLGAFTPPAPPSTLTPLPPLPATATPLNQPPPTVAPTGCDKAAFVTDVTVQDGTVFAPGAAFTKTWRLKNVGACVWTTAYKLVYYSGEQMSAPTTVNLPAGAAYGQTVDIAVNMVAPSSPGEYRGYWILANANGQFFGIGTDASKPIWVDINVSGEATYEGGYQFWLNTCSAQWRTGSGPLPCPGTEGDSKGFIIPLQSTQLEDGTMGPAPSLLMAPENKYNGYIQGVFPAFTVQPRDHFVTGTGCEYNYNCYVTFRLDYMAANGLVYNFWSWREQSDKKNNTANIDLSPLAGRSVRFILTILATGSATGDRVRWVGPSIVRVEGGTPPTITPNPSTWPTYTNSQYGFQFKYPPQAQIVDQSANSVKMNLPFTPGTNLVEKYLQNSVVENANLCQSPLSDTSPPGSPTETVMINGISFLKQTGGDAAAGNLYEWIAYSTLKGNICISMDFVLHSLGAIYPPPPVFDKAAESAVFTQIMSTFGWLPGTATPTPITVSGTIVASPQINKLYMNDSYHGWAVGNRYVLKTSDGGATWYNVTSTSVQQVISAFFQNANKGWVMATVLEDTNKTVLLRTTNGGSTWVTYYVPFNDGYIQFLDDSNGFVLAGQGIGMQKQPVSLYQTSDGGATWTLKFAHDPNQPDNGLPVSGHKAGMTFRNTTRGWIGGDIPIPNSVYIYRTDNGGVTWAQQPMSVPAGYETGYVVTTAPTFFGTYNAVLPVWLGSGSTVGQRDLYLYVTHDGGTTWTRSSAFAQHSNRMDIVSVSDAFSWDAAGFFRVTHNSGASWTQVTPNINFGDNIYDLDFVSTTTGWVLNRDLNGNTALYRTTNGGFTWTLLYNNIPVQPVPDLSIASMRIELQNTSCLMPGDLMGTRVSVQNNGQAAAGSFVLRVNNIDQTISGLGIGETTTLFFPTTLNPVTAIADATGTVLESNENNNIRSEMVPVPTPPMPCASATDYAQTVVNNLNAKNFDAATSMMGQSFTVALWQSQGTSYPPNDAIQQLQTNYIGASTVLVPNSSRDLNALLGGLNPYTIMGLDPSNSQALFVSGWGLDGKGEAILYVTKNAEGNLYWNSVLIAPIGFAPPASPVTLTGPYAVMRVASADVLNIRSGAGVSFPVIGSFPPDATNIMKTGTTVNADGAEWAQIQTLDGGFGWVNSFYLTEYVTPDAFCADSRVLTLIEQLKGSMNQSNGDMFASLIGSKHGVAINFWRNVPAVNYTNGTAHNIFIDSTDYDWGSGPEAGPTGTHGTFAQVVQPDMVDVFNSSYQLGCDNPSYAQMYLNPWPHTNIHYYSITKPPTSDVFDWKVWLVGFEYVDGIPYLYGTVHYVWEP
jgi:photosystem II stability/assembly factor-like uncharacterized protein/uncharacterized protein YgiM (DUF1202 family)